MKYMTKEWFEIAQRTHQHLLLKVSNEAETFSEAYFKCLYEKEEKKFIRSRKKDYEIDFNDMYPEEFDPEYFFDDPIDESEYEEAKKAYLEEREQARLDYMNRPPFDPEQERKIFKNALRYNTAHLKKNLPAEILQKVADIRVLALEHASDEVKKEITSFCKNNSKYVNSAMSSYEKVFKRQFSSKMPDFAEELNLHDCNVISCRKKGKDVVLTIDNSRGFTSINSVRFKNCTVLKQDSTLHGARCLYEEIYKTGNSFEIHFLLMKHLSKDYKLIDYIVSASDVELLYD